MTHEAFQNAGQEPGLEIWRIEDFDPVPYPKKDYGKFYTGDSYIVLATHDRGRGQLDWSLHFWLGNETSQDESGAAAVLTVQLDEHLGGSPVQYREVQRHESPLFLSHFKKTGVRYLAGGVASGFVHVDPDAPVPARLYQVKGKKHVRVWEVPVGVQSLNQGDCFILDAAPDTVYVYQGIKSKRLEKLKAIGVANQVRDQDHGGRPEVIVIDEFSTSSELDSFFEALGGGSQDDVPGESAGGDDEESEEKGEISLHRVTDDSGSLHVAEVGRGELSQDMLDNSDCFILDTAHAHLFLWIGRSCSPAERSGAIKLAHKFCAEHGFPANTRVERVVGGAEPAAFRELFPTWEDPQHGNVCGIRRAWQCTISRGRMEVIEIFDVEQEDLDEDDVMIIDTGSILYVWMGKDATENERNLSLQRAKKIKIFDNLGTVVTVEQGQEPEDFIQHFPEWNADFWNNVGTYEERRNASLR